MTDYKLTASVDKTQKQSIRRLIGTVISSGLLVYLIIREWRDILSAMRQLDALTLVAIIFLTILSRVFIWLRWHILLRSGGAAILPSQSARLFLAGLFASNFLPTTIGGDLVRFAGSVRLKLSPAICAASLVMDRLVGMAGMITLLPVGLVKFFSIPLPYLPNGSLPTTGLKSIFILDIAGKFYQKVRKALDSVWQTVRLWASHPTSLLLAYIATWGHMICLFITLWLLFTRLNDPVSLWLVGGLWSMSYFFTLLPISVNGLGLQEISLTFLYVNYAGAELNNVVVVALAIRVLQTLVSIPGAFFLPGLLQPDVDESYEESKP